MPERQDGQWLVEHRLDLERGEAAWLKRLGEFDAEAGWCADGQLSCVDWLMWFTKMGRSTAFEKVRVARELRRRPVAADAFASGRISYSAVRTITRAENPDPEVDEALIHVAESGSPADLERAVRTYQAYQDQEIPPAELVRRRRGVSLRRTEDGMVRIEGFVTELEAAELEAALAASIDSEDGRQDSPGTEAGESPAEDSAAAQDTAAADDSARADESTAAEDGAAVANDLTESPAGDWWEEYVTGAQQRAGRRADALMDLVRSGVACITPSLRGGGDRYLTHVIVGPDGAASLADGTPLAPSVAARVACDTSVVDHHHGPDGEPLSLGRKTRDWSTAQRRAALVRDGGHCRFPGCGRKVVDLHHHRPWEAGGRTDISNGYLLCGHHHTLIHKRGFVVQGADANRTLYFSNPHGIPIGATAPINRRRSLVSAGREGFDLLG